MAISGLDTRNPPKRDAAPPPHGVLGSPSVDASTAPGDALQRLWPWVRSLSLLDLEHLHTTELRGLIAWYQRACLDDDYTNQAPAQGIDSLFRLEKALEGEALDRLEVARCAVRAAEEFVALRREAHSAGARGDGGVSLAVARLDVAVEGARDHLRRMRRDPDPGSRSPCGV